MNKWMYHSKTFLKRNGSTILTCVGAVGTITTAVMAIKATPKALKVLEEAKEEKGENLTKLEIVKVAGPAYIPTVVMGASTVACIFGANILNKRQQASLASAYALVTNSYKEYRDKVKELYGQEGSEKVQDELAKDRYKKCDVQVSSNKQLYYDEYLGQYYESTPEEVQRAEYLINREIQLMGGATLAEYYALLNIDYDDGGVLGWSEGGNFARYWQSWIDFSHKKVEMEDGLECIIVTMWSEPYTNFEDE